MPAVEKYDDGTFNTSLQIPDLPPETYMMAFTGDHFEECLMFTIVDAKNRVNGEKTLSLWLAGAILLATALIALALLRRGKGTDTQRMDNIK